MWTPPLWSPSVALSLAEQKVAARAAPRKKLFVFLREIRGELFDDAFQADIASVREALSGLKYGNVSLTVHEGRVVQIDVTEKKRLKPN